MYSAVFSTRAKRSIVMSVGTPSRGFFISVRSEKFHRHRMILPMACASSVPTLFPRAQSAPIENRGTLAVSQAHHSEQFFFINPINTTQE
jgi:hypothetical protein